MTGVLRTITANGHTFQVAEGHASFWDLLAKGNWEPETLAIFDHFIGPRTVFLDIGSWIGPTLLYGAARAQLAVGFEPDPSAHAELLRNVAANPGFKNIQVHHCAITAKSGPLQMGSQSSPGDSMSSMLFAKSASTWSIPGRRLDELAPEWPDTGDCFVKIDIEGGEYDSLPSLIPFLLARNATVYLSLHHGFFMQPYINRGLLGKIRGELRLFSKILRFYPLLRTYPFIYDQHGRRITAASYLRRNHWRRIDNLLLSHRPAPGSALAAK